MKKFYKLVLVGSVLNIFAHSETVKLCSSPTFVEEFTSSELSSAWKGTDNVSFDVSASLFSSKNITLSKGSAVLSVKKVVTTDSEGNSYTSTGSELASTLEFGYGKYEFKIKSRGLEAIAEGVSIIWDGNDYATHHEYMGFDLLATAYMAVFSTSPEVDNLYSSYHMLATATEKLSAKQHVYRIDYFKDSVSWYFDGTLFREEFANSVKITPSSQKMKVVFKNWLKRENQYSITTKDFPVELAVDYFKYTPVDSGGKSCDQIVLDAPKTETNTTATTPTTTETNNTTTSSTSSATISTSLAQLKTYINSLPANGNYLVGFGGEITDLSVFSSAKVVWIHVNGIWKGYSPYAKIRTMLINSNVEVFTKVPEFTGFWVQK